MFLFLFFSLSLSLSLSLSRALSLSLQDMCHVEPSKLVDIGIYALWVITWKHWYTMTKHGLLSRTKVNILEYRPSMDFSLVGSGPGCQNQKLDLDGGHIYTEASSLWLGPGKPCITSTTGLVVWKLSRACSVWASRVGPEGVLRVRWGDVELVLWSVGRIVDYLGTYCAHIGCILIFYGHTVTQKSDVHLVEIEGPNQHA